MDVIDAHQHLWDLSLFSYAWCAKIPTLNRSFTLDDYAEATRGAGVVGTVHLEADVDEPHMLGETQYIAALAARSDDAAPPLCGFIAPARPEDEDFARHLALVVGEPHLKGVRRVLHTEVDDLMTKELFVANVRALADYELSFDLCVAARQLPLAVELVKKCPRVSFVLDHCGNPPIKTNDLANWRAAIVEMSRLPNVVCKVSGLVNNADHANWTNEDLRPVIEHVIERFGWERILFGSDWPVCTLAATFRRWLDALSDLTREATTWQRRQLFHDNARRVYRLS